MGEVFLSHDAVLDRRVAIKVLHRNLAGDAGFVERFRREARAAANLNHPNIVAVHDWGSVDGIYYMVMEYVAGRSVREILNEEGLLAPAQATGVLSQALAALGHAHRQGIVHRDVKPENLMVTRDGDVKVADFGLARAYADAQITEAGTVTGTVQYLAPEQLRGEPADPRTDLYSLGVVAFELLTGRLPFTGETPMAIAYKHLHDRVAAPSTKNPAVPASLDGWVASVTEPERELRPESAAEARRDLEAETRDLPPAAPLASLVPEVAVIPAGPVVEDPEEVADPGQATTVTIPRPETGGRQGRRRGRKLKLVFGLLLALGALVAGAWAAWAYLIPHEAEIPTVVGLQRDEAQDRLEEAGFVVRFGDGQHSMRVAEDRVIRVHPAEGTVLEQGERVTLVLSLGPPPVDVPELVGKEFEKARELLREAKLKVGEVNRAYHESFEEGRVVRQSVRAGSQAPQGSNVNLLVSRGPAPRPVPDVVGLAAERATDRLEDAGFAVSADSEYSRRVDEGKVISQDPPSGDELQPGSTVSLVVSLGPPEFPMPNVVGMARDAAVAELRDLGLIVDVAIVPGHQGGQVVFQEPASGTVVEAGDTVSIYVA
jgi:beta-lactam-binding protein with PASTA domain/tRNA A-37 threonylcarbamoyl transferase component Bud32